MKKKRLESRQFMRGASRGRAQEGQRATPSRGTVESGRVWSKKEGRLAGVTWRPRKADVHTAEGSSYWPYLLGGRGGGGLSKSSELEYLFYFYSYFTSVLFVYFISWICCYCYFQLRNSCVCELITPQGKICV